MSAGRKFVFSREIPVRHEVDVFVAGGGPAGASAAVAAAENGAKVFLAEAHSCLGGMGTAGLIPWFCGLSDGVNFLAGGVGKEIQARMEKLTGSQTAINAEALKRFYDEALVRAGVSFTFHTQLIGVEKEGGIVKHAVCAAKSGIFAVSAKIFIDGTGDGDLCAMAGAEFKKGAEDGTLMPATLCSLWCDIDWDHRSPDHRSELERAFKDGVFTAPDRHVSGMCSPGAGIAGANIGHVYNIDGTDETTVTRGLVEGRKLVLEYERYYKDYLKGYEKMSLVGTGSLLGVRETRRITGDYILCLEDFKKRAVFDDEIGRFSYPVDIHPSKTDPESYKEFEKEFATLRFKNGESYGIPHRALIPRGLDNVFVAGRCVSADRYIQSSIRVMPGCWITGQAAGTAAALAAKNNLGARAVNVREIQSLLKKSGVFLPNFK